VACCADWTGCRTRASFSVALVRQLWRRWLSKVPWLLVTLLAAWNGGRAVLCQHPWRPEHEAGPPRATNMLGACTGWVVPASGFATRGYDAHITKPSTAYTCSLHQACNLGVLAALQYYGTLVRLRSAVPCNPLEHARRKRHWPTVRTCLAPVQYVLWRCPFCTVDLHTSQGEQCLSWCRYHAERRYRGHIKSRPPQ
jgi:hypothetical protein